MTALDAPPERGIASLQQDVLAKVVEPGLDLVAARAEFTRGRRHRRLARRVIASSAAALLIVAAGTAVILSGGQDPDSVLADRDEQVTSSTTLSTIAEPLASDVALAVPETLPPSTLAVSTTTVAAPEVTVPVESTTTLPSNRPLTATLSVLTPTVGAGRTARVTVSWADPDLGVGAGAPRYTVTWGDPLVSTPVDTSPRAACDSPGPADSGVDTLQFRYSTPGTYVVRVVVETCGGQGAFSERVAAEGSITVTAPVFVDAADPEQFTEGQSVVVFQPPLPTGVVWPALQLATVDYVPSTDPTPVPLDLGDPLPLFTTSGPATILVLPAGATGTVRVHWTNPAACAVTTGTDLAGPAGEVLALPLALPSLTLTGC